MKKGNRNYLLKNISVIISASVILVTLTVHFAKESARMDYLNEQINFIVQEINSITQKIDSGSCR